MGHEKEHFEAAVAMVDCVGSLGRRVRTHDLSVSDFSAPQAQPKKIDLDALERSADTEFEAALERASAGGNAEGFRERDQNDRSGHANRPKYPTHVAGHASAQRIGDRGNSSAPNSRLRNLHPMVRPDQGGADVGRESECQQSQRRALCERALDLAMQSLEQMRQWLRRAGSPADSETKRRAL